jgi:hypothetical protein
LEGVVTGTTNEGRSQTTLEDVITTVTDDGAETITCTVDVGSAGEGEIFDVGS